MSFFEQSVIIRDSIYSVFDINGFKLGLFAFEKKHELHRFGNNCLPSIEAEDVETLHRKLCGLKVVFPITLIGQNLVCKFEDSEGNHIELTTPSSNMKTQCLNKTNV